jgi:hypothetical protein
VVDLDGKSLSVSVVCSTPRVTFAKGYFVFKFSE